MWGLELSSEIVNLIFGFQSHSQIIQNIFHRRLAFITYSSFGDLPVGPYEFNKISTAMTQRLIQAKCFQGSGLKWTVLKTSRHVNLIHCFIQLSSLERICDAA